MRDHFTLPSIMPKKKEPNNLTTQAMGFGDFEQIEKEVETTQQENRAQQFADEVKKHTQNEMEESKEKSEPEFTGVDHELNAPERHDTS